MELPPVPDMAMVESISEAKAKFSAIVEAAEDGRTIVICRAGKPVAMLSPFTGSRPSSRIGLLKGRLSFDANWWKRDKSADREIEKSFSEGLP